MSADVDTVWQSTIQQGLAHLFVSDVTAKITSIDNQQQWLSCPKVNPRENKLKDEKLLGNRQIQIIKVHLMVSRMQA